MRGTGGNAGAATGAQRAIQRGLGNAAQGRAETDGAGVARLAADPALDLPSRQAGVADVGDNVPRRRRVVLDERTDSAHAHALGAEGAGGLCEIENRKTGRATADKMIGADLDAIVATCAAIGEAIFGSAPRRAHDWTQNRTFAHATAQQATTTPIHLFEFPL